MSRSTVLNCINDELTIAVFCLFMRRKGTLVHLGRENLPTEIVDINEFQPYNLGMSNEFMAKDRVVIGWTGGETFVMYALGKYDIISEMRVEYQLRKKNPHVTIFKGLRDMDDCIHFYRKTIHGQPFVSRYFATT